jgi:TrmH family RNA methyltransferase
MSIDGKMITKAQVKHIRSLENKKMRLTHNEFVVEGDKMVTELLAQNYGLSRLFATEKWLVKNEKYRDQAIIIEDFELSKISFLQTPNEVLAIANLPRTETYEIKNLAIALDNLQDPGNVGSIIRIADWYGIDVVFLSNNCADAFNPKTVQSTMGSIFRVKIVVCDLLNVLKENPSIPSYAAILKGENVNEISRIDKGIILIGNESRGISDEIIEATKYKVTIPKLGHAESLNAAVACGIICSRLLS